VHWPGWKNALFRLILSVDDLGARSAPTPARSATTPARSAKTPARSAKTRARSAKRHRSKQMEERYHQSIHHQIMHDDLLQACNMCVCVGSWLLHC
jgi:hypothetical protein